MQQTSHVAHLERLIRRFSQPGALPEAERGATIIQTHASVVFLTRTAAWKIKKGIDLGFLDYSTLEKRRECCLEEVRVNLRLAPGSYLGVEPITEVDGVLQVGGREQDAVEWVVHMRRLDDAHTMASHLARGSLGPDDIDRVASRLARFHRNAARSDEISAFGALATVERNALENFTQTEAHVGRCVDRRVHARALAGTRRALDQLGALIDARAAGARPCDCHGDLRLDHVYLHDDGVEVLDAIEFNARFRYGDPLSDVAFLAMELSLAGRDDLARQLLRTWQEASGDDAPAELAAFYIAYRSVVRAKVRGIQESEPEIPDAERAGLRDRATAHWLLALRWLVPPSERPALVAVSGPPGSGKSTLARTLGQRAGLSVIVADVERKRLFGIAPDRNAAAPFGQGIYSPEATEATYARLLELSEAALRRGERVMVDATLRDPAHREAFAALARRLGVSWLQLVVDAPRAVLEARIAARGAGVSDAGIEVLRGFLDRGGVARGEDSAVVDASGTPDQTAQSALEALATAGLLGDGTVLES